MKTPRTQAHAARSISEARSKTRYPRSPVLTVDVTSRIIEESKVADSSHCMTASALELAFPDAMRISVDIQTIRFSDPNRRLRYVYLTPRIVQKAIIEFDQGRSIDPFSFRLQGGHVLPMYVRPPKLVEGMEIDQKTGSLESIEKTIRDRKKRTKAQLDTINKMNLSRQGIRSNGDRTVPERVGGKAPPTTPFSRRRAFGLRAIER